MTEILLQNITKYLHHSNHKKVLEYRAKSVLRFREQPLTATSQDIVEIGGSINF